MLQEYPATFGKHRTLVVNMLTKKMILYLVLIISVSLLSATDYYVSPNGSDDNSGTIETPFQTIQHAADLMQSGDNCYLRSGTYHEEIQINNLNGTSSDPITFTNYQGEPVILDGTVPITSAWTVHDGNIYKTTIDFDIWQLFEENRMLISARWPNANLEDNSLWNDEEFWGHGGPLDQNGLQYDDPHDGLSLAALNMDLTGAMAVLNVGNWKSWTRVVQNHAAGQDYLIMNLLRVMVIRITGRNTAICWNVILICWISPMSGFMILQRENYTYGLREVSLLPV